MGTSRFGLSSATPAPAPAGGDPAESRHSIGGFNGLGSGGLMGTNPRALQQSQATPSRVSASYGVGGPIMGPGGSAGGSQYGGQVNQANNTGGVQTGGQTPGMNAVQNYQNQGPDLAAIQAEMARKNVGAQLNANPQNSALAGYMMG